MEGEKIRGREDGRKELMDGKREGARDGKREEGGREGELLHDCSCHQLDTKTLHNKDNTGVCTTHFLMTLRRRCSAASASDIFFLGGHYEPDFSENTPI